MITHTIYGPLPNLNLTYDELKVLVAELLSNCSTFDFIPFINALSEHVKVNKTGIEIDKDTVYTGGLSQTDTSRVREIIWDFIVDRYITLGGNGHDTWPTLTITERGKAYFGFR
ncbi:hypothetical protein [Sphingobacterium yanglingense]|uniref:Mrr restriction endonuclease-like protein n=1 Tax=Sphingobacterium yanglingense TaxID=1437280 RepID=A0A4R6WLA2_9SPHI|nr:hypothetical protein [Sphingobacterium yanglingense]TDQ79757.1 hypothetical protein CLV99_1205 [Sphingobacterium yanglingense]